MQVRQMPKPPSDLNNTQVMPSPVLEKRTRRQFSADFKLRIIAEADACKHGELGGLLRREKLYSNQLADWMSTLSTASRDLVKAYPAQCRQ